MNNTPNVSYFCPNCASAMVDTLVLSGRGQCRACGWEGVMGDLLAMPHVDGSSPEELFRALGGEVAMSLAKEWAKPFALILVSWGFIDETNIQQELQLYVKNAASAVLASVFRTREALEQLRKKQADEHVAKKGSHDA